MLDNVIRALQQTDCWLPIKSFQFNCVRLKRMNDTAKNKRCNSATVNTYPSMYRTENPEKNQRLIVNKQNTTRLKDYGHSQLCHLPIVNYLLPIFSVSCARHHPQNLKESILIKSWIYNIVIYRTKTVIQSEK